MKLVTTLARCYALEPHGQLPERENAQAKVEAGLVGKPLDDTRLRQSLEWLRDDICVQQVTHAAIGLQFDIAWQITPPIKRVFG